jgi:PBP1b-binding outer membrane lipoprotein LpoB
MKRLTIVGLLVVLLIVLVSCAGEPEQVEVTRIVEQTVTEVEEVEVTRVVEPLQTMSPPPQFSTSVAAPQPSSSSLALVLAQPGWEPSARPRQ